MCAYGCANPPTASMALHSVYMKLNMHFKSVQEKAPEENEFMLL